MPCFSVFQLMTPNAFPNNSEQIRCRRSDPDFYLAWESRNPRLKTVGKWQRSMRLLWLRPKQKQSVSNGRAVMGKAAHGRMSLSLACTYRCDGIPVGLWRRIPEKVDVAVVTATQKGARQVGGGFGIRRGSKGDEDGSFSRAHSRQGK